MQISDITDVYNFDSKTGLFSWKESSRKGTRKSQVGSKTQFGYLRIRVNNKYHCAHRLVWLLEKGVMPTKQIDHINGNRSDNRIKNLREVDPVVNSQNQRKAQKNSKTQLLGASLSYSSKTTTSWKAQIKVRGKSVHLGHFKTPIDAHNAEVRGA